MDYRNKEQVIARAKEHGPGHTVVRFIHRNTYNIIRTKEELILGRSYGPFEIIHRVEAEKVKTANDEEATC